MEEISKKQNQILNFKDYVIQLYYNDKVIERGEHSHDEIELIIPLNLKNENLTMPNLYRVVNAKNPHSFSSKELPCDQYLLIFIPPEKIEEHSYELEGKNKKIEFQDFTKLQPLNFNIICKSFRSELISNGYGKNLLIDLFLNQIEIHLIREVFNITDKDKTPKLGSRTGIQRSIDFIKENYKNEMTVDGLAKVSAMSKYHFIHTFKNFTGETPYQFILKTRVNEAVKLLKKDLPIIQIAYNVGFGDVSQFNRAFRKVMLTSPTQLRKEL